MVHHIDPSHDITRGMVTYPGLPAPQIADHLTARGRRTFRVRAYATVM